MSSDLALQTFAYRGEDAVRTVVINGEPWFCAHDVCQILGHSHTPMALKALDDDERRTVDVSAGHATGSFAYSGLTRENAGPNPQLSFVSEPGLYTLIIRSRKAEARPFRRWVTHEVLPELRKRGTYSVGDPVVVADLSASVRDLVGATHELRETTHTLGSTAQTLDDSVQRLSRAIDVNSMALARFSTDLSTGSVHRDIHSERNVVHRPVDNVGREPVPPDRARRRLSPEVVAQCRRRVRAGEVSVYRLAREFRVSDTTMRSAVHGLTYRDVAEPPVQPN